MSAGISISSIFFSFVFAFLLIDVNYCNSNDMILTESSKGSMCLHGVPTVGGSRKVLSLEIHLFLDILCWEPRWP